MISPSAWNHSPSPMPATSAMRFLSAATPADRIDLDALGARVSRGSLGVLSGHRLIDLTGGSSGVGDAVREQDNSWRLRCGSIVGIEQDGSALIDALGDVGVSRPVAGL
jgi:hypothetical protein